MILSAANAQTRELGAFALIGSVLSPYLTRNSSHPCNFVCALLIWPGLARNRVRDQRREQTQPQSASWPSPILARPHGVSCRRMEAPVKARARVDCAGDAGAVFLQRWNSFKATSSFATGIKRKGHSRSDR
jgi:hypothetical protein